MWGRDWLGGGVNFTGDIYQSHELSEHYNLLIKILMLVLRSENTRECQTLDAEKLTEIGELGSGKPGLL